MHFQLACKINELWHLYTVSSNGPELQRQLQFESGQDKSHKDYLHFDPAVYSFEDFSVVDGMDLDQEGETLRY